MNLRQRERLLFARMRGRRTRTPSPLFRDERGAAVLALLESGMTLAAVAAREGVSKQRIHQIVDSALVARFADPRYTHPDIRAALALMPAHDGATHAEWKAWLGRLERTIDRLFAAGILPAARRS
jgi:hypothetical protein